MHLTNRDHRIIPWKTAHVEHGLSETCNIIWVLNVSGSIHCDQPQKQTTLNAAHILLLLSSSVFTEKILDSNMLQNVHKLITIYVCFHLQYIELKYNFKPKTTFYIHVSGPFETDISLALTNEITHVNIMT